MDHPPPNETQEYLVRHQEQVLGPFGTDFVEAMIMSGVYPATVNVQKVGTTVWIPFSNVDSASSHGLPHPKIEDQGALFPVPPITPGVRKRPKNTKPESVVAWVVGTFGVLAVLWIIGLVTSSGSKAKTKTPSVVGTSYPAPSTSSYRTASTSKTPNLAPRIASTPPAIPEEAGQIYRDASGRTYRVSNSDYYRLLSMKTALSSKQTSMNFEETRLKALSTELDQDRTYLNRTNQYSVDAFNRKVGQVNSLNDRVQALVNDFNRDVDAFNAELARVGTLIR